MTKRKKLLFFIIINCTDRVCLDFVQTIIKFISKHFISNPVDISYAMTVRQRFFSNKIDTIICLFT